MKPLSDRVFLLLAVLWMAANVSPRWYPTPDSAGYLSVARELADTGRLRNLDSPHIYYPVGYAVLIAPAFLVDAEPFLLISLTHLALGTLLVWLAYRWMREYFPEHAGWAAFVVVANVSFGHLFRRTLGETAFMVSWMLAGFCFQRLANTGRGWGLATVAFLPLVLIRPAGAMLAGGFAACLALAAWKKERPWRSTVLLALAVVPAAAAQFAWMVRDRAAATEVGQVTYSEQFRDGALSPAEQVLEGFRLRVQETGRLLLPGMFRTYARTGQWLNVNMALFVPLAVAVAVGWWRTVRRSRDVMVWALPFYFGLYVMWPHDQTTRFFTPILPMLLVCLLTAAARYPQHLVRRAGIAFAVLHLGVAFGYWLFDERPANTKLRTRLPELRRAVEFIPSSERDRIAVSGRYQEELPLMSFLVNRPVSVWDSPDPVAEPVRWVVVHDSDPPPVGFAPVSPSVPHLFRR